VALSLDEFSAQKPTALRIGMVLFELAYGGVERQAELLGHAAKNEGHHIELIVLGPSGPALDRFPPICATTQILNADLHHDRALHRQLTAAMQGRNWDAALIFSTARIAVLSHAIAPVTQKQAVYVGNPVPQDWSSFLKQKSRAWRFSPARELVFLGCSDHVLQSLRRDRFFRHFPCRVSWNCVPIPPEPIQPRQECRPIHFGMVARLDRIKDQATLIEALALLRQQNIAAVLHFVGQGEKEQELRQLAQERGVQAEVRFEGTTADVFAAMAPWDLCAFSTTREEGFGAAAAEAMALGLPCLFTDTGPCREVGGETVVYIPEKSPADWARELVALADDFPRRQHLGRWARERACRLFTKERMWREYRQALGL
jgi:glycosyltransferase involved in cell wall biosynthesis